MPKICTTMAFLCFTFLMLPNSIKARQGSNSRYLLVELDGSPDMVQGSDDTTEEPEMSEPDEEPSDDSIDNGPLKLEPGTLTEDDGDVAIPEMDEPPAKIRNLNANAATAQQGGYRSSN